MKRRWLGWLKPLAIGLVFWVLLLGVGPIVQTAQMFIGDMPIWLGLPVYFLAWFACLGAWWVSTLQDDELR